MRSYIVYAVLSLSLALSAPVRAEVSVSKYREVKNDASIEIYVSALEHAYGWSNAFLVMEGRSPIFCAPEKMRFTHQDLLFVIDRETEALKKKGKDVEDSPIGMLLLLGLKKDFPCKK
jgi:hypothetical protein